MDKSATTIISSCTVKSGETTALSTNPVDLSRSTQLIFTVNGTIAATATEGLALYLFSSTDDTTYDDKWWDKWDIPNCRQVAFTSGDYEFMPEETVTSQASGTATVVGWTLSSGAWADGDAAGNLYLEDISGTFTDTQTLTGSTSGCSAVQNGTIAAHAITRTYFSTSPTPLYIKCRLHNKDTSQDATLCSVIYVKQSI